VQHTWNTPREGAKEKGYVGKPSTIVVCTLPDIQKPANAHDAPKPAERTAINAPNARPPPPTIIKRAMINMHNWLSGNRR